LMETGEVSVPDGLVTVTDVGLLVAGHHAKYHPSLSVEASLVPLENVKMTAVTPVPT
jgi:hypothetical protein